MPESLARSGHQPARSAELNEQLEQRVAKQTEELTQKVRQLEQEVAEGKQAEKELREAEARAHRMLDAIPQQIWSAPADGNIDYFNYAWRAYYGLTLEELQGEGWQQILHPDDAQRVMAAWRESVEAGKPYEQEVRQRAADGSYRWFLVRSVPLRDSERRIERWYGSNTDISEQKHMQEALRKGNDLLRNLARRNVRAHEEERRRLVQDLYEQVGQLLTAAKLNLQTARSATDTAELSNKLGDTSDILDRVIQEIRKISSDLRPPVLDDLGLAPALRSLLSKVASSAEVTTEFIADPDLRRADAESETACYRLAVEAVTNAVRHAMARKIAIEVRNVDSSIELRVRDDGSGFDPTIMEAAHGRDSLGLSGMRERAIAVGGQFEIISTPGKGTEIVARFPTSSVAEPLE